MTRLRSVFLSILVTSDLLVASPARSQEPSAKPVVKLLRLVIVDDSPSMAIDNRIGVVRSELTKQLQQLPPSPEYPVGIVTFGLTAQKAKTFVDLKSALAFIGTLRATSFGTNISAGLAQGLEELQSFADVTSVWVMLYSDGEDSNKDGILEQEAKLDALFADREQRGLDQTVVFCKRWGNVNALLLQRIEERGRARVIDIGEAELKTVTMEPSVAVHEVHWLKDKPGWLEVEFTPSIVVRGDSPLPNWPAIKMRCQAHNAEGDVTFDVTPGQPDTPRKTLRLPVPKELLDKPELPLSFDIDPPSSHKSTTGVTVPLLAGTSLQVPVKMPDVKLRNIIVVGCDLSQPPRWTDPLRQTAAFPVTLTFDVTSADQSPRDRSATFRIIPNSSTAIIAGDPTFKLPGPGKHSVPLTLELTPRQIVSDLSQLRFGFELTLRPEHVPANLTFEPARLHIKQDNLAPPTAVRTSIEAKLQTVSRGVWTDLCHGLAAYSADVQFHVNGPISPGTQITLVAPAAVKQLQFSPKILHSGTQTVRLSLTAAVAPAPHGTPLALQLVPPPNLGAIELECRQRLRLALPGPNPVRLVMTRDEALVTELSTFALDNHDAVEFSVHPVLWGSLSPQAARSLRVDVQSRGLSLQPPVAGPLSLFETQTLSVKWTASDVSFFSDTVVTGQIDVRPAPATPAVLGSRYPVSITVLAAFKQLLVLLAISLSIVLTVVLLWWMVAKLRHRSV